MSGVDAMRLCGNVETDGSIVYVNGMDLAHILRAVLPHRDRRRGHGEEFGRLIVTISVRGGTEG